MLRCFRMDPIMLMTFLFSATIAESTAQPYPSEIYLKAGVIPSESFGNFQADLLDRLIDIALEEDNVTLTVEKKPIQEQYGPNLALLSPDCNITAEVKGEYYYCDDYDFIIGDYWTNPDRYTIVDFTPPWLTTSVSTMKYTEKTKNPNLDVTTLTEATRAGVPVCALESSYTEYIVKEAFPDVEIVNCPPNLDGSDECVNMLRNEECGLVASDELVLRKLQAKYPEFEMTGELMVRQLLAWPVKKSLDPTSSFLLNKWMYAALSKQVIDDLYFEYYEKKLCPIGTAGVDCELPCDPDHGSSDAQGRCVCKSIRYAGDDCSVEVPQELNLIPPVIKGIAFAMFGLNAILVIIGGLWLRVHWDHPAVKYSQPFFLLLVLLGCFVSTSTILAMAQEDEGDGPVDACIAIPWLYSAGFSITFGTLFAKIYRVYAIFSKGPRSASQPRRATVSFRDTLSTIGKVLVFDFIILVLWTGVDPLHWERNIIQQDQFGFTLESQGSCTSTDWKVFLAALVALHVALCCIACYMCYVSRNIPSRYSEHKYLTIAMVSNLQVFAIGVPVLIIAEDDPAAHFFVRSAVVWMNDFVVLALIFGNLIYAVHFSKSQAGQITGQDRRKVSEALRSFEPRQVSVASNRRSTDGHSGHGSASYKIKALEPAVSVSIESDMESGSAMNRGTQSSSASGSLHEMKQVSEISMSGFSVEHSSHGESLDVPTTPQSGNSKSESASSRWVPSPSLSQQKSVEDRSHGPSLPTRVESVVDQPEEIKVEAPSKLPISNSNDDDDDDGDGLEAQHKHSQKQSVAVKKEIKEGVWDGPVGLTSIAELEWSDEEEDLTNQTPPALLESAPREKPPVMPIRFKSEAILDA